MADMMKVDSDNNLATNEQMQLVTAIVQQIMTPVMENIGLILERNNQAMERIAATQQALTDRISDLEKQVRLKTPLSRAQEKYINDAIRAKARELLEAKGVGSDQKAVTKLGAQIRKSVLSRYGVNSLREAPSYDYETCLVHVKMWNDMLAVRDVVNEARRRAEHANANEGDSNEKDKDRLGR